MQNTKTVKLRAGERNKKMERLREIERERERH